MMVGGWPVECRVEGGWVGLCGCCWVEGSLPVWLLLLGLRACMLRGL